MLLKFLSCIRNNPTDVHSRSTSGSTKKWATGRVEIPAFRERP